MNNPTDNDILPATGENFARLGPWRITTGGAWHDWQCAAIEAEIKAALANGDTFGAYRGKARLQRLKSGQDQNSATLLRG
jgi:hypothetical protein